MILASLVVGAFLAGKNSSAKSSHYSGDKPNKRKNKEPTKSPSPSPQQNNNFSPKTLANAIKSDLRDILTNESRQKNQKNWFSDYQLFDDGDIAIRTKENKKLKEELQENFNRNYYQRKEKMEEEQREYIKKHGFISSEEYGRESEWAKFQKREVWKSDLEPQDHQEIVNLIRQARELIEEKKHRPILEKYEKLDNNNKLFLGTFRVIDRPWKIGRYVEFLGKEKGKLYRLSIPENHPGLAFLKPGDGKERFYWIEGAENIPIEKNPPEHLGSSDDNGYNYHKWVSLNDKIIIGLTNF